MNFISIDFYACLDLFLKTWQNAMLFEKSFFIGKIKLILYNMNDFLFLLTHPLKSRKRENYMINQYYYSL